MPPTQTPIFPQDFSIIDISSSKYSAKYYSHKIGEYEITVEPELTLQLTVALYKKDELYTTKIINLLSIADVQAAINLLFLKIDNQYLTKNNMIKEQFAITKKLHALIPKVAKKYGVEIKIKNYKVVYLKANSEKEFGEAIIGSCNNYISDSNDVMTIEEGEVATTLSQEWVAKIEEPQIRKVLLALEEALGENPELSKTKLLALNNANIIEECMEENPEQSLNEMLKMIEPTINGYVLMEKLSSLPKTYSEALCVTWFGGLTRLFDKKPVKVLTEFLNVLEKLNNSKEL